MRACSNHRLHTARLVYLIAAGWRRRPLVRRLRPRRKRQCGVPHRDVEGLGMAWAVRVLMHVSVRTTSDRHGVIVWSVRTCAWPHESIAAHTHADGNGVVQARLDASSFGDVVVLPPDEATGEVGPVHAASYQTLCVAHGQAMHDQHTAPRCRWR